MATDGISVVTSTSPFSTSAERFNQEWLGQEHHQSAGWRLCEVLVLDHRLCGHLLCHL